MLTIGELTTENHELKKAYDELIKQLYDEKQTTKSLRETAMRTISLYEELKKEHNSLHAIISKLNEINASLESEINMMKNTSQINATIHKLNETIRNQYLALIEKDVYIRNLEIRCAQLSLSPNNDDDFMKRSKSWDISNYKSYQ